MKKTYISIAIVVVVVVLGAWWWVMSMAPAPAAPQTPSGALGTNGSPNQGNLGGANTGTPQAPQGDGTGVSQNLILGINVSPTLGNYLTAYNGMTLYTYAKDTKGVSNCSGVCAVNWPPYTVGASDKINVPAAVKGTVATITRADGSLQITYNGMPVYFFKGDIKPGDTTGQGVGGIWYVAKP